MSSNASLTLENPNIVAATDPTLGNPTADPATQQPTAQPEGAWGEHGHWTGGAELNPAGLATAIRAAKAGYGATEKLPVDTHTIDRVVAELDTRKVSGQRVQDARDVLGHLQGAPSSPKADALSGVAQRPALDDAARRAAIERSIAMAKHGGTDEDLQILEAALRDTDPRQASK